MTAQTEVGDVVGAWENLGVAIHGLTSNTIKHLGTHACKSISGQTATVWGAVIRGNTEWHWIVDDADNIYGTSSSKPDGGPCATLDGAKTAAQLVLNSATGAQP